MVLTFTLTAGLVTSDGPEATRELLVATIGCNLAWSVIDAAMYVMARLLERNRARRALRALHEAPDAAAARALVDAAIEEKWGGDVLEAAILEERERLVDLVRGIADRVRASQPRLRREDLKGAALSGLLVLLATIPAAVPFLFVADPVRALRSSNGLLLALLFLVGFQWGKYVYARRWLSGL